MAKKYLYLFSEGNAKMREILGGKGANLAEMTNLGLPVPQGLQSQQKLAHNIMKMAGKLTMKSKHKLWNTSAKWKKSLAKNLVIKKIHYSYQ